MRAQKSDTSVLLMAMGGPSSLDDIEPFLGRFMGGRGVPRERLEAIKERYRLIGGRSPLVDITLKQTRALEAALANRQHRWRVFAGMRFSEPFIADTVTDIVRWGTQRLLAVPLALYRSKLSTAPYFETLKEAMETQRTSFRLVEINGWHSHPLFIRAVAEKVTEGLSRFPPSLHTTVSVIFTVHSLPEKAVRHDPYIDDIQETIESLMGQMGPLTWRLAFQSRGRGPEPWLGPDVGEVLENLAWSGCQRVLVVPLGFVSDHVETLYDLDIQTKDRAERLGLEYHRAPSLNDSPLFMQALAQIVSDAVQ